MMIGGKYRVLATLGRGAMGVVVRAEQLDAEGEPLREVAVKTIQPDLLASEQFAQRFLREVRVAAQLKSPHVVTVFDSGRDDDGTLYFAMELVDAPTLAKVLRRDGAQSARVAATIVAQVCQALAEAHELAQPVVHRDLKPANVFLDHRDEGPWAKVGDFGIVKIVGEDTVGVSSAASSPGTPRYMAPEQWRNEDVDARADLYAIGIMLFEMLSGHVPFQGPGLEQLMYQHLEEPPPPLPDSVPEALRSIVGQLLAKRPQERPDSAREVRSALLDFLAGATGDRDRSALARRDTDPLGPPAAEAEATVNFIEEIEAFEDTATRRRTAQTAALGVATTSQGSTPEATVVYEASTAAGVPADDSSGGPARLAFLRERPWMGVGLVVVVILVTLAIPGLRILKEGQRIAEANAAVGAGRARQALEILDPMLRSNPQRSDLVALAVAAGEGFLDQRVEANDYEVAFDWLRSQLDERPYLEGLRHREPVLDALATAARIRAGKADPAPSTEVQRLLDRYPGDPAVARTAAEQLEGMDTLYLALDLYQQSLARGGAADDALFDFSVRILSRFSWGSILGKPGYEIMTQHYPDRARAWAIEAMDHAVSGQVIDNAWKLLRELEHPYVGDPHYEAVAEMTDGFADEAAADRSLALFLAEADSARRERVLGLHRWVLAPTGVRGWGWTNKALVERNLARLEAAWLPSR